MLDVTDSDWRMLQQVEALLSSLSTELEPEPSGEVAHTHNRYAARRSDSDLRILRGSLAWVRRHECVAPESELQLHLDTALRSALGLVDRSGRWQQHSVRSCRQLRDHFKT